MLSLCTRKLSVAQHLLRMHVAHTDPTNASRNVEVVEQLVLLTQSIKQVTHISVQEIVARFRLPCLLETISIQNLDFDQCRSTLHGRPGQTKP